MVLINFLQSTAYDAYHHLTSANFNKSGVASTGLDASCTYNNNGNLLIVRRYTKAGSYIDNISIQYTGNKLNLITDLAGDVANTIDYPGSTTQTGGFSYDSRSDAYSKKIFRGTEQIKFKKEPDITITFFTRIHHRLSIY
jgi:hypothetical protein